MGRGSEGALGILGPALERDPERLLHALAIQYCSMTLGFFPDAVSELLRIPTETCDPGADIRCFPDVAAAVGADINGLFGGILVDDLDGDGSLDILRSQRQTTILRMSYRIVVPAT